MQLWLLHVRLCLHLRCSSCSLSSLSLHPLACAAHRSCAYARHPPPASTGRDSLARVLLWRVLPCSLVRMLIAGTGPHAMCRHSMFSPTHKNHLLLGGRCALNALTHYLGRQSCITTPRQRKWRRHRNWHCHPLVNAHEGRHREKDNSKATVTGKEGAAKGNLEL